MYKFYHLHEEVGQFFVIDLKNWSNHKCEVEKVDVPLHTKFQTSGMENDSTAALRKNRFSKMRVRKYLDFKYVPPLGF